MAERKLVRSLCEMAFALTVAFPSIAGCGNSNPPEILAADLVDCRKVKKRILLNH